MTPALPIDIKQRIVQLRWEVANHLRVFLGVVHKTLEVHGKYGEYTDPSKRPTEWPRILDDDDGQYLKSLLGSGPPICLDEIKQKLGVARKVSVSMATVSRFLRSRGFTWKALTR